MADQLGRERSGDPGDRVIPGAENAPVGGAALVVCNASASGSTDLAEDLARLKGVLEFGDRKLGN
jgi:hypothetical protein